MLEKYSPRLSGMRHQAEKRNYWPIKSFYSSVVCLCVCVCVCVCEAVSTVSVFSDSEKQQKKNMNYLFHSMLCNLTYSYLYVRTGLIVAS